MNYLNVEPIGVPGQTVTIYEDPVTQLSPEGIATLVRCEGVESRFLPREGEPTGMQFEYWKVKFERPDYDQGLYYRTIMFRRPTDEVQS